MLPIGNKIDQPTVNFPFELLLQNVQLSCLFFCFLLCTWNFILDIKVLQRQKQKWNRNFDISFEALGH